MEARLTKLDKSVIKDLYFNKRWKIEAIALYMGLEYNLTRKIISNARGKYGKNKMG